MNERYLASPGVQYQFIHNRPVLSTEAGGRIAVDRVLLALWHQANGRSLEDIVRTFRPGFPLPGELDPQAVRAGLACLAEAGLLDRSEAVPTQPNQLFESELLVSAILVSFNSRPWLEACLPSLLAQRGVSLEIILVDNGSSDDTVSWTAHYYPQIQRLALEQPVPLAAAINRGVELAQGDALLILNPDIELMPDAVSVMLRRSLSTPDCAAVAPKLRFTWAPAFLNGVGNRVGPFGWGADNGLGHLDLGQFDSWQEVPSACFATVLIPRPAWDRVGRLDEGFPMYYEDSEWSYRARLQGLKILAAPDALIYHAFSGRVPSGNENLLGARKLKNVVFGRLRFAAKLLGFFTALRFLLGYALEDGLRLMLSLVRRDGASVQAILSAWGLFLGSLGSLNRPRRAVQLRRRISDRQLFHLQRNIPAATLWRGLPELTWDLVQNHYLPLLSSGQTRLMPEFKKAGEAGKPWGLFDRATFIYQVDGPALLLQRIARWVQWFLARP